jgi:branched-chain amino acid transport system permease protein
MSRADGALRGAGGAFRDAGLSALVALGLFAPLIGLRTNMYDAKMVLTPRAWPLAAAVAAVFVGRLALIAWRDRPRRRAAEPSAILASAAAYAGRFLPPVLLAVAVALPFFAGRYVLDTGIQVMTYVMLGWGLNVVVGLAGLLDLGYVAFYAVGAYSYALLSTTFGLGFWTCLPLAGLFAATAGLLLGFPVLRLRGDYLAIVTLGFGEIIRIVINNWVSLTNGPNGILDIPLPTVFGLTLPAQGEPGTLAPLLGIEDAGSRFRFSVLYLIILGLALVTNWVTLRLRRMPLGRAWEALREDEIACRSLGINVTITKLTAFAIGATFAGFAGAFFATRQAFISPESFTFAESALVLAIVVLGGLGSQLGVALAALIMIGGFELFREFAEYRMLFFGIALVLMMVLRPRGLVSGRTASVSLGPAPDIAPDVIAESRAA